MLSATHTLLSLPIGFLWENPILSFLAAATLHFLADTVLHWNIYPKHFKRFPYHLVALDVGGGLAVAYLIIGSDILSLSVLAAIAGGNFPDVVHSLWEIAPPPWRRRLPWFKPFIKWHDGIQRETTAYFPGLLPQIVAAIAVLGVLLVRQFS